MSNTHLLVRNARAWQRLFMPHVSYSRRGCPPLTSTLSSKLTDPSLQWGHVIYSRRSSWLEKWEDVTSKILAWHIDARNFVAIARTNLRTCFGYKTANFKSYMRDTIPNIIGMTMFHAQKLILNEWTCELAVTFCQNYKTKVRDIIVTRTLICGFRIVYPVRLRKDCLVGYFYVVNKLRADKTAH